MPNVQCYIIALGDACVSRTFRIDLPLPGTRVFSFNNLYTAAIVSVLFLFLSPAIQEII